MNPGEDTHGWGTQVYPGTIFIAPELNLDNCVLRVTNHPRIGVNAHNHQHLFNLRIDANIDGPNNTVFMVDAVASDAPVGSSENYYGNAFSAKRTKFGTVGDSATNYDGATSRTWDICNTSKLHPYSGKPASYKLVSREVASLLPKEGSLVWRRAAFARHAVHVTKCERFALRRPVQPISADTYIQIATISSGQQVVTYHRRQASHRSACRSGWATAASLLTTQMSFYGIPLVSHTSQPPRTSR